MKEQPQYGSKFSIDRLFELCFFGVVRGRSVQMPQFRGNLEVHMHIGLAEVLHFNVVLLLNDERNILI